MAERARIRAAHTRDETLHRHIAQELVLVVELAIREGQFIERYGRPDFVAMNDAVPRLHGKVANLRDVLAMFHRIGKLEQGQLALAAADDVDAGPVDHVGRIRRVRPADDDRDVEVLLDLDGQLLEGVADAGQRGERDQPGVVACDGADEVRRVRDEEQISLVPIGLQDARQVRDADRLLNAIILNKKNTHSGIIRGN